jgi:hypothetical protein
MERREFDRRFLPPSQAEAELQSRPLGILKRTDGKEPNNNERGVVKEGRRRLTRAS